MHTNQRVASSQQFHHSCRPLRNGEAIPRPPSLAEQLMACQSGMNQWQSQEAENEAVFEDEDFEDEF